MIGYGRYDEQNIQWPMENDGVLGLVLRVRKREVNGGMQRRCSSTGNATSAIPLQTVPPVVSPLLCVWECSLPNPSRVFFFFFSFPLKTFCLAVYSVYSEKET